MADEWLCVLVGAPFAFVAGVVVARLLPSPEAARVRLLERKVDHLHQRLLGLEAAPPAVAAPPTIAAPSAPVDPASDAPPAPAGPVADAPAPTAPPAPPANPAPTPEAPAPAPSPAARPPWPPLQLPSLERLVVWIGATFGALLLAFGGLFAVVAAVEAGWFGPGLRVAAGMVAGTAAWVLGAAGRRRAHVASTALSAAGASTVFGAVWAATSLYRLVPTAAGFVLLMVVVTTTMLQASRFRDRYLGVLAVIGGLLASLIVEGDAAEPRLAYAVVLNVAVAGLAARRGWPELLVIVGLGTAAQIAGFALDADPSQQLLALGGIAALMLPHATLLARRPTQAVGAIAAGVAATYLFTASTWVGPLDDVFYDARTGMVGVSVASDPWRAVIGLMIVLTPAWFAARRSGQWFAAVVMAFAAAPTLFAFTAQWTGEPEPRAAVAVGVVALATALFVAQRPAGAGMLPVFAAAPLLAPVDAPVGGPTLIAVGALTALATFTSTSRAALVVSLPATAGMLAIHAGVFGGENHVLAAILLLTAIHLTPAARRSDDPVFPQAPWLGALVAPTLWLPAALLWWDDALGDAAIGALPLCVAAASMLVAVALLRRHRVPRDSALFAVGVIAILGAITLAVPLQLQERWLTVGWALEGAALAVLSRRLPHPLLKGVSVVLGVAVAVRLLANPWALSWGDADGWPILNWTLYTWGVPTVCLLVSAHALRDNLGRVGPSVTGLLQWLAMFTGFALVNVQVSHAFQDHGPIQLAGSTMLQGMVRSLSWGAYGSLLLGVGLAANSRATRLIGFAFILLGAMKVTLYDLWTLPGLIRVGSLVGLGLFLVVAAFAFERLVLRPSKAPEGA